MVYHIYFSKQEHEKLHYAQTYETFSITLTLCVAYPNIGNVLYYIEY